MHNLLEVDCKTDCKKAQAAVQDTLYVVNGKWKMGLLSILINNGTKRFGELVREAEISPRILSKELQELEMNLLITRKVCNTKPVTVEYSATPYSRSLMEVIDAMVRWGTRHREMVAAASANT